MRHLQKPGRPPSRRLLVLILALLTGVLGCLAGCATTGPGGQRSLILISTEQEVQIGEGVDQNLRQEFKVLPEGELTAYIDGVGRRVAAHADRKDVTYHFAVLDDDIVNAFAAPGGFIYITTGLLKAARSEAEVAAVLGHEVGHVVGRHSVRRLQTAYGVALATDLVIGDQKTMQAIIGVATQVVLLKNSRSAEFEADEFGLKYSGAAGYDPAKMLDFFQTLLDMQGGSSPSGLEGWFSTHPATEDRITRGRELLSQYTPPGSPLEVGADRYLTATASLQ